MKVLIIEDDKKLANTYKNILSGTFDVVIANSLTEAKKKVKSLSIDVVLLDIMLPDGMGYKIIPFIKRESNAVVIIISALDKQETKRLAYEQGADDYMIKPITLFELEFKLKAYRKRSNIDKRKIEIGDMELDFDDLTLSTTHKKTAITHSQGLVLKLLYEKYKEGDILSKNELANMEEIRKTDNFRIHTLISRLRKTIEKIESDRVFIENDYGKGYRLVVMK